MKNINMNDILNFKKSLAWKTVAALLLMLLFYCILYSTDVLKSFTQGKAFDQEVKYSHEKKAQLKSVLERTAMANKTVIITTVNAAWANTKGKCLGDLFLESFRAGQGTQPLLQNLIIVALDESSLRWCRASHSHCFLLTASSRFSDQEEVFMSQGYLDLMWARILFLSNVLALGYNFVFTDADILWFRNPFLRLSSEADFQIASDYYTGHWDMAKNTANGGLTYVVANERTIKLYRWWYESKKSYPGLHDQDVLNKIKTSKKFSQIGVRMYFLDTSYFSGFCQMRATLSSVYTMHANCCKGLHAKIQDLSRILHDWKLYQSSSSNTTSNNSSNKKKRFTAPTACPHSW